MSVTGRDQSQNQMKSAQIQLTSFMKLFNVKYSEVRRRNQMRRDVKNTVLVSAAVKQPA